MDECHVAERHSTCFMLIKQEELKFYQHSLLETFSQRFSHVINLNLAHASLPDVMKVLSDAESAQEPIIVHCSTGQARTANILALWLHRKYNISIEQAVQEVILFAQEHQARRNPSIEAIVRLVVGKTTTLSNTMITPQTNCHISFIQMGGTIDKDYPRLAIKAYAFEIGEMAVKKIVKNVLTGFTYDFTTVCRKDSQELTSDDRAALVDVLNRSTSRKIIITHGSDTLIDTAQYLQTVSIANKTIICTGAMRPATMIESDAMFNIGCAVSALHLLSDTNVYVAMNGSIIPAAKCQRDLQTGLFYSS